MSFSWRRWFSSSAAMAAAMRGSDCSTTLRAERKAVDSGVLSGVLTKGLQVAGSGGPGARHDTSHGDPRSRPLPGGDPPERQSRPSVEPTARRGHMYPGTIAREHPDRPAVVMATSGEVVTFRQLDERSNQLAHLLRAVGLGRGDHIALFMENHPRFLEVVWAALRSGLYVTAVNSHLTAEETAYIVDDCEA